MAQPTHHADAVDASVRAAADRAEVDQTPPMPPGVSRVTRIPWPREATWFWRVLWCVTWFLRLTMAKAVAEGREHIPATGGCVVTCNHTRGFDYVPLGYCSPRQLFFMVKAEAFAHNRALSWILYNGGGMPVQRGRGDTHAVHMAIAKVADGFPVAIFVEGTRSHNGALQAAYTGAVRIAMHTNTPIIPSVVIGAEEMLRQIRRPWVRPAVLVRYGEPMYVQGDPADKALVAAETRRVLLAMVAMLPPSMHGVWADGVGRVIGAGRHGAGLKVGSKNEETAAAAGESAAGAGNAAEEILAESSGESGQEA